MRFVAFIFIALIFAAPTFSKPLDIVTKINKYLAFGDLYAAAGNAKAVVESGIKHNRGEEDAFGELMRNTAKLAITDIGKKMAEPLESFIDNRVTKNMLVETKKALATKNTKLLAQSKALLKQAGDNPVLDDALEQGIKRAIHSSEASTDTVKNVLKADLKTLKNSAPGSYKILKGKTKWLRVGGKAAKGLGPIFDVVAIGFDTYDLVNSEPGTNEHTSAALGIASSVVGIAGFVVGLFSVVFPPAALIGAGLTAIGYGLSIASTTVGLIPDEEEPETPQPPNIRFDNIAGVKGYNEKIKETVDSSLAYYSKAKDNRWDAFYLMSETNLIDWETTTKDTSRSISIFTNKNLVSYSHSRRNPIDNNIIFGTTDPKDTSLSRNNLNCLPYKNQLLVNGFLRATTSYNIYGSCSDQNHKKDIGFDFVGVANTNTRNRDSPDEYQGVRVLCLTDNLKNSHVVYQGVRIDTEGPNFETAHTNGNDVVVLGDFQNLAVGRKVDVFTYGGDDTLSITSFMGSKARNLKPYDYTTPFLYADLGSGFNFLSFEALSKDMVNAGDTNLFQGIKFEIENKKLYFQYLKRQTGSDGSRRGFGGTPIDQYIGTIDNVNSIDTGPYDNFIILGANKQNEEREKKGIEDFSVKNLKGQAIYFLGIDDRNCDGYIRRFILYEKSNNVPYIRISGEDQESFRITFRRSRQLRFHCYDRSKTEWRIFAMITLIGFKNSFSLMYNGQVIDPNNLGSVFTEGKTQSLSITGERRDSLQFSTKNDQVILKCNRENDLSRGDSEITIDMGEGNANTVVIGRMFFMGCGMEPPSYSEDISESIGERDDTEPSSVQVTYDSLSYKHIMTIERGGITKTIRLANVQRIADDVGNTIVELKSNTNENNLVDKISEVFGYAVEAFQNSLYFGIKSQLELQVKRDRSPETSFTIEFKPEKNGILMSGKKGREEILDIVLMPNKKAVIFNPITTDSGRYGYFPGNYLMDGWNKIKVTYNRGSVTLELNGATTTSNWSGDVQWHRMKKIFLGYKNINFGSFGIAPGSLSDRFVKVSNGFRGEINKVTWNDEEVPFLSRDTKAEKINNYD